MDEWELNNLGCSNLFEVLQTRTCWTERLLNLSHACYSMKKSIFEAEVWKKNMKNLHSCIITAMCILIRKRDFFFAPSACEPPQALPHPVLCTERQWGRYLTYPMFNTPHIRWKFCTAECIFHLPSSKVDREKNSIYYKCYITEKLRYRVQVCPLLQ